MMHPIDAILDGWFGEALADAEDEDHKRRHLYGPLRKAFDTIANNTVYDYRVMRYSMNYEEASRRLSSDSGQGWNTISVTYGDLFDLASGDSTMTVAVQSKKRA